MNPAYLTLAGLIRSELGELERTRRIIESHWSKAPTSEDPDAYAGSTALHLHALYSGAERMMERIARDVDGRVPSGEAWHSELLLQMKIEVPGVRPAVLTGETAGQLEAYRRFRHRVRNVYASLLDPGLMEPLVTGLDALMGALHRDLEAFCRFLESIARAEGT